MIDEVAYKHVSLLYTYSKYFLYLYIGHHQFIDIWPLHYVRCMPYGASLAKYKVLPCT